MSDFITKELRIDPQKHHDYYMGTRHRRDQSPLLPQNTGGGWR
jgi:hypothetical protein